MGAGTYVENSVSQQRVPRFLRGFEPAIASDELASFASITLLQLALQLPHSVSPIAPALALRPRPLADRAGERGSVFH